MKLKLIIVFVFGLLTIPSSKAQETTSYAAVDTTTDAAFILSTAPPSTITITQEPFTSSILGTTQQPPVVSTGVTVETTMITTDSGTTTITLTTTSTTTSRPLVPIFECDFTGPCFGNGDFALSDGLEFAPIPLTNTSEPPRAPISDALSTINLASNNEKCALPYKPRLDGSNDTTTWDMWFCFNGECPTPNGQTARCASDYYGLISLAASESKKTVYDSFTPHTLLKDASGDQCLRFYYYFTVYDGQDWGQRMKLFIRPHDGTDPVAIKTLTVNEMKENKWNFAETTIKRTSSNDTLQIDFEVVNNNRTANATTNRAINFGMDMIELYDYNCTYVAQMLGETTRPPPTDEDPKPNLGLILGLSLGIGIPVLLLLAAGVFYFCKASKPKPRVTPTNASDNRSTATAALVNIPLVPTKNMNENTVTSAIVV